MPSSTVENYLKTIYSEQAFNEALVPMGRLAAAMSVSPGTATSMVQTLAESGLTDYEPRKGTRLTERGKRLALHVLRRHRLIELFLVEVLKFDWSDVHTEAEELEHAISDKVLERIDVLLDHPSVDPHGDPIPTSTGHLNDVSGQSLAECELGRSLVVMRVLDQDVKFLQFVERHGLTPGVELVVGNRNPIADSVTLNPDGHPSVTVGTAMAQKILVE